MSHKTIGGSNKLALKGSLSPLETCIHPTDNALLHCSLRGSLRRFLGLCSIPARLPWHVELGAVDVLPAAENRGAGTVQLHPIRKPNAFRQPRSNSTWMGKKSISFTYKFIPSSSAMRRCFSTATNYFEHHLKNELGAIKSAGTFKNERVILGKQGVLVKVTGADKPVINFCANNYLGLSSHPEVIAAGQKALETHGAGLSSVRFICGTQDIHKELERKIAEFHGTEDAILYAACFDANGGVFEVMTGEQDSIISDELNHASIIDGIRLSKAKRLRYKHLDLSDLETKLKESQDSRFRLIVTDGVFSMDGDVAPLKDISSLAEKYNALLFIDECHATGFFGKTGRGTAEAVGGHPHVINSTLGKALGGSMGGYTTGPKPLIDLLRQRSRPYLFSNSLAPSIVGSSIKVFELLMNDSSFIGSLQTNVAHFRKSMAANGFTILGNDPTHPICPVLLGDAKLAATMADELLKQGIYVIGFSYPVVPKGKARIRVQISAAHKKEHIDQLIEAFATVGKKLNVV